MKIYLITILTIVYIVASFWVFNHINVFLAIIMLLVFIGVVIKFLIKQINN